MAISSISSEMRSPLYHQIYLVLKQQILDGTLPSGARLPAEQELMETYGVSRITAKRALDELAGIGLVERKRGRGTTVKDRPRRSMSPVKGGMDGLLESLLSIALETQPHLLHFDYVRAPDEVTVAMGLPFGTVMQHAVRIRVMDGVPFSYLETYVPEEIGRRFDRQDLAEKPMLALLEEGGLVIEAAEQTFSATLAAGQVAEALGVDMGTALLKLVRVVKDETGRPVEYITALYRPDRYQYRMALSRVRDRERGRNRWQAER